MQKLLSVLVLVVIISSCKKPTSPVPPSQLLFSFTNFNKVSTGGNFKIQITRSNNYSIAARGRQIDLDDINASVANGELFIEYKNPLRVHEEVLITIAMPSLRGFQIYNRATADIAGFTEVAEVEGTVGQYSNASVQMNVTQFTMNVLDNSELLLKGSAEKVYVRADNKGVVHSYAVLSSLGHAIAAKNSTIRIHAADVINASAVQNSTIYYKGNPGNKFIAETDNSRVIAE
jgi:hypothetical protein